MGGPFETVRHRTKGGTHHQFESSVILVVMRASEKCQDFQARMGLKDDVVGKASEKAFEQDHRAPCLQQHARMSFGWRRASHFVVVFVMDVLASGSS